MNIAELKFRAHSLRSHLNEYAVQGRYKRGWEDVTTESEYALARIRLHEYELNEPLHGHRIITRRVPNPDRERFYVGQGVAVHPAHAEWMRGFKFGTVVKVGYRWVHVAWSVNPSVVRAFAPADIAPVDGS